ncbi:MAG: phosphopyruvate hydratase [Bacillota bacterium]|nr:phosphopyruvate hydratase [Bacillota bacterium]
MAAELAITSVKAREILDSRATPTVEVEVTLACGVCGRAAAPSGASTGRLEALELRDGGTRYRGRGVLRAMAHVNELVGPVLAGRSAADQRGLDEAMRALDGTPNKARLGANAVTAVSMAAAHAAAAGRGLPLYRHLADLFGDASHPPSLPVPMLNIINGGLHADNNLDIQEYMIVPHGMPSFRAALQAAAEVYAVLRGILKSRGLSVAVGDEGGFAPDLAADREGLQLITEAIEAAGYRPGEQISIALDSAATNFAGAPAGSYRFEGAAHTAQEMMAVYSSWIAEYPIVSLEDPLGEDDWPGWRLLTGGLGPLVQVVGDDLFVTNTELIRRGVREGAANSALIKVNQVGTLSETVDAVNAARAAGWTVVISHRSGETEDTTIADLAVGLGAGQIKAGAPCRSERVAKYNRLLRIEEHLGAQGMLAPWLRRTV